jgi:hypothetical protein
MDDPDRSRAVDHENAEAEAQAALNFKARERKSMSAREFVSEKDALEDAWASSDERHAREEGW